MRPFFGGALPQMLDVSRNPERCHFAQRELAVFGPFQELHDGQEVGRAGVVVRDIGGKEIGQPFAGMPGCAAQEAPPPCGTKGNSLSWGLSKTPMVPSGRIWICPLSQST